ncbi:NHL repeat-containing protein [Coniochaeta ligniaria NRRL 30616]|uniref:NHL repeat-containing protein n=1 Tax=Coniochaeta ligniaria NRRL 30616 TaxID=1408157 RepID=A0A1J7IWZ7_9PEZI|nr:NHL repeat-containing protein [Coniochaeta ligniaria NRRL 30616]
MKIHMLLGVLFASTATAQTCMTPTARFKPQMDVAYTSTLLINGLRDPRDMVFDQLGNMLVVEQGGGGVTQIKFMELSCNYVCAISSKTVVADPTLNHGLALSPDGNTLFVSSVDKVYAYNYDAAAGTATGGKVIISNMGNGGHSTRTLLISKFNPDLLLVSRGSNANIDALAGNASSGHSTIKYFNLSMIMNSPEDHVQGGVVLGWGLRNSVGVGEHPTTGGIWSVENSMDNVYQQGTDVHNNNPAEEVNYHGVLGELSMNPLQGASYGYPFCVAAWDPSTLRDPQVAIGSQFYANIPNEYDIGAFDRECADYFEAPRVVLPAHTAPLDIKFTADGSLAFVSLHGSWDRSPPDGYRVMRIDFGADGQPASSPLAGVQIMANPDNTKCPGGCFRPTGLAVDSKGRLFMSSDSTGEIYLIMHLPGASRSFPGCTPRSGAQG